MNIINRNYPNVNRGFHCFLLLFCAVYFQNGLQFFISDINQTDPNRTFDIRDLSIGQIRFLME